MSQRRKYSMNERLSYHRAKSSFRGSAGAYHRGYLKGAKIAMSRPRRYSGKDGYGGGGSY